MKRFLVLSILMLISIIGFSQVRPHGHYYGLGVEVDGIPYLAGGYHGSLWWGYNHVRIRGVVAKTEVPDFMNKEGFSDNIIKEYGVYGDYFFEKEFEGGWLTFGGEYWDGSISNIDDFIESDYSAFVLGVGFGYTYKFWENFSVNPGKQEIKIWKWVIYYLLRIQ